MGQDGGGFCAVAPCRSPLVLRGATALPRTQGGRRPSRRDTPPPPVIDGIIASQKRSPGAILGPLKGALVGGCVNIGRLSEPTLCFSARRRLSVAACATCLSDLGRRWWRLC